MKTVIVDIETTGLRVDEGDTLLELAALELYSESLEVGEVFHRIRHMPAPEERMDEVVRNMHTQNGLLEEVKKPGLSLEDIDRDFAAWLDKVARGEHGRVVLCGSSIHFDDRFIRKLMPMSTSYLHYRLFDARTIRMWTEFKYGVQMPTTESTHRALDDCHYVLEVLRWAKKQGG